MPSEAGQGNLNSSVNGIGGFGRRLAVPASVRLSFLGICTRSRLIDFDDRAYRYHHREPDRACGFCDSAIAAAASPITK
jgi:hypothetical protein